MNRGHKNAVHPKINTNAFFKKVKMHISKKCKDVQPHNIRRQFKIKMKYTIHILDKNLCNAQY